MRLLQTDATAVTLELTRDEVRTLGQALNEVCHGLDAIEDWEFRTRMGVQRNEAKALLDELGSVFPRQPPAT
jgi:hypothetical protein